METKELQDEIQVLLDQLGWSKAKLSRIVFMEENESDDDEKNINKFNYSFIKELSRSSTKKEKLSKYLNILLMQREVKKLNLISPYYQKTGVLSKGVEKEMFRISKDITQILNNL